MFTNKNRELAFFDPFESFNELEKAFFGEPYKAYRSLELAAFKTDIKDEGDKYVIESDLPGFKKEDINVDINGEVMTVTAERHSEHEEEDKKNKYVRCERSYGSYTRKFDLSAVNAEEINGKYENGVLTITLPKKQPTLPTARRLSLG